MIWVNSNCFMLIQRQCNRLIFWEILTEVEIRQNLLFGLFGTGTIVSTQFFLTKIQPQKVCKKDGTVNVKLSKTQLSKVRQSGGLLWTLLSKIVGPLMVAVVPLAQTFSVPTRLTGAEKVCTRCRNTRRNS